MNAEVSRDLILAVIAAIPAGSVMSYGEVAERAGLPKRARLVARVLSQLPDDSGCVDAHRSVLLHDDSWFALDLILWSLRLST